MSGIALVVVDVQHAFLDGAAGPVGSWEKAFCLLGVRRAVALARQRGWRIIHVGTVHDGARTLPAHQQRRGLPPYCERDSPGAEFVVAPEAEDAVVLKQWYSAFDSDLEAHIAGIETIVWTGVATDCCIQQSAFDGDRRRLRNVVPIQAVSASECEAYVASLVSLAKSAADVIDIDGLGELHTATSELPSATETELAASARHWFGAQQQRTTASSTPIVDLDDLLARLAGAPA